MKRFTSKILLALALAIGTLTAGLSPPSVQATIFLKQSTASQIIKLGPFVDSTDGNTEKTALTIANTDVKLSKAGGTIASKNSGGCTHDANGWYTCTFDATDTATVGALQVYSHPATALPVTQDFQVVEEAVYDALFGASALGYVANAPVNVAQFGGTNLTSTAGIPAVNVTQAGGSAISQTGGLLNANMTQVSGDATAADNVETAFDDTAGAVRWSSIIDQGTAQAATGTSLQLRSAAAFADNELSGSYILITGGTTGVGQVRQITSYVGSTDTATVGTWTTTPTGTITYQIDPFVAGASGLTTTDVENAVWNTTLASHTTGGTAGERLGRVPNAAAGANGGLPTVNASNFVAGIQTLDEDTTTIDLNATALGSVAGSVGSVASGGITEASFATTAGSFDALGIIDQGTAQAATSTTLQLRSAAAFADDELIGGSCLITGGSAGVGQARVITDYVGSTDTATVDAWTTTPTGTIVYECFGTAPSSGGGSGLDAAGVRAAVGLASANLDTQLGAIDDFVDTEVAAIKTKTDFLPSATAGATGGVFIAGTNAATTITTGLTTTFTGNLTGNVNGTVNGLTSTAQGNVRTAVGLGSANLDTQLGAIDDFVDTEVAAVKAVTDKLDTALELDGAVYRFTTNALEQGPSGAGGGTNITQIEGVDATDTIDARIAAAALATATSLSTVGTNVSTALTRIGTPVGASLSVDIAGVESGISWNAAWDAEVESEALDALNSYDPPTRAELTSDVNGLLTNQRILTGTCSSGSTTTCVDAALTQAAAAQLQDRLICFDDSWCAMLTTFNPATDTVTTTKVAPSTRSARSYTIFPATAQ